MKIQFPKTVEMEKNVCEEIQSEIVVIGAQIPSLRNFASFSDRLTLDNTGTKAGKWSNPQIIANHNGLIALIDQKNDLWVLDNSFTNPLNLTEILRMKAKRVFLGEGQLIFENRRKTWILVNWSGKIDVDQNRMRKVNIHNSAWNNTIDAYFLEEECEQGSIWYYSTIKKLENTLKVYLMNAIGCEIIGFPSRKVIKLPEKMVGMSLGKYHGLCWTVSGRIFAWGCKNLAMGLKRYDKGYYDEAQQISVTEPIFKGQAGTNYSVALSVSGNLYEWGISNFGEPILTPRALSIKGKKFLDLKSFQNAFVGLTSANELYLWGRGMERYLTCPKSEYSENVYAIPKEKGVKIYDYHVEENCIITLLGKDNGKVNKDEKFYFTQVVRKVSQKWLPHRLKKEENSTSYSKFRSDMKENEPSIQISRKNEDYIDRLICNQMNKQEYFTMVQNEEAMFKKIMDEKASRSTTRVQSWSTIKDNDQRTISKLSKSKILKCHRKVESARQTPNLTLDIEASNRIIKEYQVQQGELRNHQKKSKIPLFQKRQHLNYESRLEAVLTKKCKIQQQKREERLQLIQKKLSVAKRQHRQAEENDFIENKTVFSKLQKHLCKAYIVQLLKSPLELAREIKIKQLINNSNSNAISENMKSILYQSRAVSFLKTLMTVEPKKYELIAKVLVRAIQCWRMKKDRKYKKEIVKEMIKFSIKRKIEYKLSHVWVASRKIQKIAKWLSLQQKQRTLQLKMLWKKSLLLYLKPTPSFQNKKPSICREDMNYKLCNDRSKHPRLLGYLNNSPICKLKLVRNVTMNQLNQNYSESLHIQVNLIQQKDLSKKGVSWAENEVSELRFDGTFREQRKTFSTALSGPMDILLYSQHYDCFYKPKNYQINIPDCMKQSQKWVLQEKKILSKLIKEVLYHQWKKYYEDRIVYQQKLAYFIKQNYEILTESRWKYLIEYNKIKDENNLQIVKKEKELHKLLRKINAENLLVNDVIPQKYKIIEYARNLKGSPTPPSLDIFLSQQEFKKQFRVYYESVSNKAKYLRKFYN